MTEAEYRQLLDVARKAQELSYAPYSHFRVGAAALSDTGEIIPGCNIENAAYGPTVCAERVAIFSARARGCGRIRVVAIVSSGAAPCPPCGTCRQVLWELVPEAEIVMEDHNGEVVVRTLKELLPMAFGPDNLKIDPRLS